MKSSKDIKKMQTIGSVRLRLGMTQQAFSRALNISRSYLAACETGKHMGKGLDKLSWLEIQLNENAKNRKKAFTPPEDWQAMRDQDAMEQFASDAETSRVTASYAEARLGLMVNQYPVIVKQLGELDMLIASAQAAETPPPIPLIHLQTHRFELLEQLAACDKHAQLKLRYQVAINSALANLQQLAVQEQADKGVVPEEEDDLTGLDFNTSFEKMLGKAFETRKGAHPVMGVAEGGIGS